MSNFVPGLEKRMPRAETKEETRYMATNDTSSGVAVRDERRRYLKGMPGGPGRSLS
jgi:hypothetical protein